MMNEQLDQLALIAKDYAYVTVKNYIDNSAEFEQAYLEKFAELLVKECVELTLDYKNDEHYKGWLDYRDEIKKHFGVKI